MNQNILLGKMLGCYICLVEAPAMPSGWTAWCWSTHELLESLESCCGGQVYLIFSIPLLSLEQFRKSWDFAALHQWWWSFCSSDAKSWESTQFTDYFVCFGKGHRWWSKWPSWQQHTWVSSPVLHCFNGFFHDTVYDCCPGIYSV